MAIKKSNYLSAISHLFEDGRLRKYPKNQLVQYQGDPLSHIHMIKNGFVKAYTILDSGDTRTILILGPGDIFPLAFSSSLDWENYTIRYFYQTLCTAEIVSLSNEVLREHIESSKTSMNTYMNYIAASNQAIMNQLEVMKNKKAIDKVAMLLPYLITKAGKKLRPNVYQLQLKLSHQELADLSGVTRETTTTLFKELENHGVIDQHKGYWLINTKALAAMSHSG